ncbi:glycine reductase complex component [Clostridium putrefaciens]|uniref:Glycine reductase complex component n=1 Tax=Clostridium putrefaciens TaxID=99675 RepID=A0A381J5J9_9CLOT|nr:GrdX family protein [Clostridium putrefaciens]SUY46039.1 glycine reductase complex component [Clostridium putrefaciens]
MDYQIITNNPVVKNEFENVYFVDGDFQEVMVKVRDMVHQGYDLISHPLGASIRIAFSPFRSIIIGQRNNKINPIHVEIIENSIISLKNLTKGRVADRKNDDDYSLVDRELLISTLESFEKEYISKCV